MYHAQTIAQPVELQPAEHVDGYARRGVAVTRDAASLIIAALRRDAYEMRQRGGSANAEGAATNDALAQSILEALR